MDKGEEPKKELNASDKNTNLVAKLIENRSVRLSNCCRVPLEYTPDARIPYCPLCDILYWNN